MRVNPEEMVEEEEVELNEMRVNPEEMVEEEENELNELYFTKDQERTRGGPSPPPRTPLPITSSSGNLDSTLHCTALTQTKRLRKEFKYILIHNNTLQSFV